MQQLEAVVSLKTIVANARLVKKRAGVPLIAVVKDDAYGHGAEAVAHALAQTAEGFAVATVREGAALRAAGVGKPILVFTPLLDEEEALFCLAHSLTPTVGSPASLRLFAGVAEKCSLPPSVQLAVNTGMNRYGVRPGRAGALCRSARAAGVTVTGVYSHLYLPADARAREEQLSLFLRAREEVLSVFPGAVFHLSATGGVLAGEAYRFDAVRCGIALYGYLPTGFEGALAVRPAMRVYASVARRGKPVGGGAGYARAAKPYGNLNTLRVGYGDGFFRTGGLGVGDLCMDACIREGDLPVGRRVCVLSDAAEYAARHGTTAYEVLVNVGRRAEKRYI